MFDRPNSHNEKDAYERAKSSDIREYWIQMYVKENYKKLGFSNLEGPFDIGPDFKAIHNKKQVLIETERNWESYILHKHYEDEKYKDVKILVVLTPAKPTAELKNRLPKKIIYIDIEDFVEWWRPKAKDYSIAKRIKLIIDLIAGEFQRRYVKNCQDKERDMATCPDCDTCAYFGEGIAYEAQPLFHNLALTFIAKYKHKLSENFKLTDIEVSEIEEFYCSEVLNAI